jgi:hypothetical protein
MGKKGGGGEPAQKVDHGGDYFLLGRPMLRSPAYASLSLRARSSLFVLLETWTGWNNGKIGLSIENLGRALGNQNHRANSAALLELMDRGFIECTSGADHHKRKAREYRLTFVQTGQSAAQQPTNEWRNWTPRNGNTSLEPTAVETWKRHEPTAAQWKLSTEPTATRETETCGFGGRFRPEPTASHIVNQDQQSSDDVPGSGNAFAHPAELRAALDRLIDDGRASAAEIARAINMLPGTMSKFRSGRNLPEKYRGPLHWELGRRGAFQMETDDAA